MRPSRTGVSVFTWGTTDHTSYDQGIVEVIKSGAIGENVGHASILLTLPDTPETQKLLDTYIIGTRIPYEIKKYTTKAAEVSPDGKVKVGAKNVYEENVVEIYFSWWPGAKGFQFKTFVQDCNEERSAKHQDYAPEWEQYLQPTTTRTEPKIPLPSFLLKDQITLSSLSTAHLSGASDDEKAMLLAYQQILLSQADDVENNYHFASVVVKLNGKNDRLKYALNADDQQIYQQMKIMKKLQKELYHFDPERSEPVKKEHIKKLLISSAVIKEKFSGDINASNRDEILDFVTQELDDYKENSFASKNKKVLIKSSMNKLYDIIDKIDKVKHLQAKLNEYNDLSGEQKIQARAELTSMIAEIDELKAKVPFAEDNRIHLLQEINGLLDPRNGPYYKRFSDHYVYSNHTRLLQGDATAAILHNLHTEGQPPDHTVTIPFKSANHEGIDPEEILKQMNAFANSKGQFRLIDNNCSVTASKLLAKGAKSRGWVFEQKAFGQSIATPQIVYENAVKYASTLRNPNITPPVVDYYTQSQNTLSQIATSSFGKAVQGNLGASTRVANAIVGITALSAVASLATSKMAANFIASQIPFPVQSQDMRPQTQQEQRKKPLQFTSSEKGDLKLLVSENLSAENSNASVVIPLPKKPTR